MITVNLEKAKIIAHTNRRQIRAKNFEPYDLLISKQIPGKELEEAELKRQSIRDKDAEIQIEIDAATDVDKLKSLLQDAAQV
jgi:D-serine deaminase-like pyridoxal phosphate-dependent protein